MGTTDEGDGTERRGRGEAPVTLASSRAFFGAIARRYDRAYALDARTTRARKERVLRLLPDHAKVLVLGVGTGRELGFLQDAGHAPVGLDHAPEMLAICARRARPVPLVEADFWRPLPFEHGAFDAAIALHGGLAHPEGDEGAAPLVRLARELGRVVRLGGAFLAEVPSPALVAELGRAGAMTTEEFRLEARGVDRLLHHDNVANVALEARVFGAADWQAAFDPWFALEIGEGGGERHEPAVGVGAMEMVVTGRRRDSVREGL